MLEKDFSWFIKHFRFCNRYLEKSESIIDFYLKSSIPCELVTDKQPLSISYENGTELGNLLHDQTSDSLAVFVRWSRTIGDEYSFSLQIFDQRANKVLQMDSVIGDDPIDVNAFNLAGLPPGVYIVKLIVYDRESLVSQPGVITTDGHAFEREVEVLQFTIQD